MKKFGTCYENDSDSSKNVINISAQEKETHIVTMLKNGKALGVTEEILNYVHGLLTKWLYNLFKVWKGVYVLKTFKPFSKNNSAVFRLGLSPNVSTEQI